MLRICHVCFFASVLSLGQDLHAQGYAPADAARHMRVPDGFEVSLVASEPEIRQPVAVEFDDRGRLWVVQYLQYPNPAGLKRVKVDRFSRTVYDRKSEPPPRGAKGSDRITIVELNAEGQAIHVKDFVNGLNLASGIAFGYGGVFVINVPYLLFYPDRDGDDVPDDDPEVLLTGFGMEDAHAVANSLTWGPDGWLYGCQGSTVTANIRGIEFQQGVWRYHPLTKEFELFCEGGGNSWGLDFDPNGQLIYTTNNGPFICLHGVQGGYYWKSFGKHGALHNPYTFGYFDHVVHAGAKGGHVSDGGIIYQGDAFPESFRGKYILNNLLSHEVYWHELTPVGSTFASRHAGDMLISNDTWFAPSDLTMGPDGALYVADWCDKRTAHPDPDADWDRTNGRVYRIAYKTAPLRSVRNLSQVGTPELIAALRDPSIWYVRHALRVLAERRDSTAIEPLRRIALRDPDYLVALRALWGLNLSGGLDEPTARALLKHRSPHVRDWVVRLLGDRKNVEPSIAAAFADLAAHEPSPVVRSQLACTARRLPVADALPIVWNILARNEDARDIHIPLLLWWAVEHFAVSDMTIVLDRFSSPDAWQKPMVRDVILARLMKRYAAEGTDEELEACARMLADAPSEGDRKLLIAALDEGLEGRRVPAPPPALKTQIGKLWTAATNDLSLIRVAARLGFPASADRALALALDDAVPQSSRESALMIVGEAAQPSSVPALLKLVGPHQPELLVSASLRALQHFSDAKVGMAVLSAYPKMSTSLRSAARDLLFGRKPWILAYLQSVANGTLPRDEVPPGELARLASHQDADIDAQVRSIWGAFRGATPEEKLADVRRFNNDLRAAEGNAVNGRALFTQQCAICHRLFNEGKQVGPDLTQANRKDRDYLLVSIVDPSAQIRKEYTNFIVETHDGRVLTGLLVAQTPANVTLVASNEERTTIPRSEIAELRESTISLMPEDQLSKMKPDDLRDLFAYLQSDQPPK